MIRPVLPLIAFVCLGAAEDAAAPAQVEAAPAATASAAANDVPPNAPAAAADANAAPADATASDAAKPTAPTAQPDPTAAIVAQGAAIYRARDVDALVLIAARHAKRKLTRPEEEQLRQALAIALPAREPFVDALRRLPVLPGPARDQLVLDLVDFQGEPAAPPASGAGAPGGADGEASGEVLVRLPPLALTRELPGVGRRQLTLGLALYFRDPALAKRLESKAPLIQDAVLGQLNQMPPADFANPDHESLKLGLAAAIAARIADFPGDGVLITQLDVEEPAPANAAAAATDAAPTETKATPAR